MFWDTVRSDVRHALRLAMKAPVVSGLTLLALALGIGATSAIFAVVNGVLLRPLPYRDAGRLVSVWSHNTSTGRAQNPISPANYVDFAAMQSSLDGLAPYFTFVSPQPVRAESGSELAYSVMVGTNLFNLLGRTAALGRALTPADGPGVVVLSDAYWRRRFGGDPTVIGRTIDLTQFTAEVVGVMPPDFVFPYANLFGPMGFTRVTTVDMWLPIAFDGPQAVAQRIRNSQGQMPRGIHWLGAVGRLKPGVTAAMADADLQAVSAQLATTYPDTNRGWRVTVVPMLDQAVGPVRTALLVLLAGISAVLLMATVNVANLMLARSAAREREVATRAALGASRSRLARQALTESLLYALAGGFAGLVVMTWLMRGLVALAPADMPRIGEVTVDARVLIATLVAVIGSGLIMGILPALGSAGVNPQATLQAYSRGSSGGAGQRRARSGLVIAEVALALALTASAGLLIRSFVRVLDVDPGFRSDHLLTWQMNLPPRLTASNDRLAFYQDFFTRLEALPGVERVGATTRLPLGSTSVSTMIEIEGRAIPEAERPEVEFRRALHDYFDAMGIPVVAGRAFGPGDGPTAPGVAMINQTMARQLWPGQSALGRHVRMGAQQPWLTIVGVIGDVRHQALEETPRPELYIPGAQGPPVNPFVVIRTSADPSALIDTVREAARAMDKDLPLYDIRTMQALRAGTLAERRFILVLVGAFGTLALGLAGIGVYGVMSVIATERRREVGVRLALGAEPRQMLGLMLGQAGRLAGLGVAGGLALVLPVAPLLRNQLYGIGTFDLPTLATVVVVLLTTAVAAALIPARRAMSVDPAQALRAD